MKELKDWVNKKCLGFIDLISNDASEYTLISIEIDGSDTLALYTSDKLGISCSFTIYGDGEILKITENKMGTLKIYFITKCGVKKQLHAEIALNAIRASNDAAKARLMSGGRS